MIARKPWLCFGALSLLFSAFIYVFPVLGLSRLAFFSSHSGDLWNDSFFWHVVIFTYEQAFLSAGLSLVFGGLLAFLYANHSFPGRGLLWTYALVPFSLPVILVVLSFLALWGRGGAFEHLVPGRNFQGWFAILIVHVFFNAPLFFKNIAQALSETENNLEKLSLSLGATRFRTFWGVTLPKIRSVILSTFGISTLYCASSFLVVLLLGGGPRFTSLEVAIYESTAVDWNPVRVSQLALFQLFVGAGIFVLTRRERRDVGREQNKESRIFSFRGRFLPRIVYLIAAIFVVLLFAAPLLSLGLDAIRGLSRFPWERLGSALGTSLCLAVLCAFFAVPWAFGLVYWERHCGSPRFRKGLSAIATLPILLSTLLLTAAWISCFPDLLRDLRGSLLSIACIQAVGCLPLVSVILREGFNRIPDEMYRLSSSLGGGPWQRLFGIEIPMLRSSLVISILLSASFSLGEVGAVLLLLSEGVSTLPLAMYRSMGRYGFDEAAVLGGVLLLLLILIQGFLGRTERWLWYSKT